MLFSSLTLLAQTDAPLPLEMFVEYFMKLGGWAVGIGLMVYMRVSSKARQREVGPQPFIVDQPQKYVTQETFEEFKRTVLRDQHEIRKLIKDEFTELKQERTENIKNLHAHISSVDHAIQERLKEGNQRMTEHGESIAALEERTRSLPGKGRRAQ